MKDHELAGKMWKSEPTTSYQIPMFICSGSETCMKPCYEKAPHTLRPYEQAKNCEHTDHTDEKHHVCGTVPCDKKVSNLNAV